MVATLSKSTHTSKKYYRCDWCQKLIDPSMKYIKFKGVDRYGGRTLFLVDRRHLECAPDEITRRGNEERSNRSSESSKTEIDQNNTTEK